MKKPILGLLATMLFGTLLVAPGRADVTPDVRSLPFAFNQANLPSSSYGEPQIVMSRGDHVLVCAPGGGGVQLWRSVNWTTFKKSAVTSTGGGGDCDIAVGPDNGVYIADLQIFASAIHKSIDDGQTFTYASTEDPVEQDRQFLEPDPLDGSIVYFAYHDFVAESEVVAKSTEGGQTFVRHTVASTDPTLAADTYPNTYQGNLQVDPTNNQRIYLTWTISNLQDNVATCPPTPSEPLKCPFGLPTALVVGVSNDGGLTWTNKKIIDGGAGSIVGNLQPRVSIDSAGNAYIAVAGHIPDASGHQVNGLYYVYTSDHGATWSSPIKVGTGTGATVFPTVAAGNDGVVDFTWLESTANEGNDASGVWSVKFAQVRDAHSAAPAVTEATGPIVRHGAVCVLGIGCNGNRQLLDFMGLALDSFGYAQIAVASTEGAQHIVYYRQDAGPSAYSAPCAVNPAADCVYQRPGPRP
jgi:hypothetical protein